MQVAGDRMPGIRIHQDGKLVTTDTQTSDWGGFTKAGGRGRVSPGHGQPSPAVSRSSAAPVPVLAAPL